jgi:hypothetical protein
VLDVVYTREPDIQKLEEGILVGREGLASQDLQEVAKVVAAKSQLGPKYGAGQG